MLPLDTAGLQRDAREHLMLHFTDMSVYADRDIPIYTRGEGCHLFDAHGRRFIDGLSGLFCTNLGHSYGAEVGDAAARAARPRWSSPRTGTSPTPPRSRWPPSSPNSPPAT